MPLLSLVIPSLCFVLGLIYVNNLSRDYQIAANVTFKDETIWERTLEQELNKVDSDGNDGIEDEDNTIKYLVKESEKIGLTPVETDDSLTIIGSLSLFRENIDKYREFVSQYIPEGSVKYKFYD